MKELSIEQKAKAYDEAIKKAGERYNEEYTSTLERSTLAYVFPVLKGERIRKELIGFLEYYRLNNVLDNETISLLTDSVAWLEKQGESNRGISEATKQKLEDVLNKALEKETQESWNEFLDEQGEQKSNLCDGCVNRKGCINCENGELRETEQKPADKFEIGDLITNGILVGKIDRIYEWGYHVYFGDYYSDVPDVGNWHKWTIQDAKDGDVLAAHECLVLFKEIDGLNIKCYCTYHFMNTPSFYVNTLQNKSAFHPATKEQRDTLEKAMADAGYTFDFEKKEFKKIEQKPVWSEEDETKIKSIIVLLKSPTLCAMEGNKGIIAANIKYLNSLKERIGNFDDGYKAGFSAAKHNQWKPSDEQMNALEDAIRYGEEENIGILSLLYNELKKLKGE